MDVITETEIIDALVAKLQAIPELVVLMGGDTSRIFAYHDRYPEPGADTGRDGLDWRMALWKAPAGSLMVMATGRGPARRGGIQSRFHSVRILIKAGPDMPDPWEAVTLIETGTPAGGDGQPMLYTTVHSGCDSMDTPTTVRSTLVLAGQDFMLDYLELSTGFPEIGVG